MKKQLSEVPGADISTIHSFCAKLLRSHFYLADVDSAFRVIGGDDAEGTALKNAALDELLEEGYEQKEANNHYSCSNHCDFGCGFSNRF
jgi:ATP-dependent helicase/nuclease subunit A